MPPHIVFISYDGMTDPLGQSQVIPYLLGVSRQYGYVFSIVSAEKKEAFTTNKGKILDILKDTLISWHPIVYHKFPPVLSTLLDVRNIRQKVVGIHRVKPISAIHARSYLSALVGLSLQKSEKIPFIFDMRGFWADERIDGGLWSIQNPFYRLIYNFFKKKEKEFLQKAHYTVSLTHEAKKEIQSWAGFSDTPIAVIPCCVDMEVFKPALRRNTSNKLTVSYLGSIGTWYLLREMLFFFKILLKTYPEAQFLFITAESPTSIYLEAEKIGLSAASIQVQKAERHQVPALLAQSHFSLFFIKDAYSKKASSATKMAEILAMGIPIITNTIGDHRFLATQYNFGHLMDELSPENMQKVVGRIPQILQIPAESLRAIAESYFSLQKGIDLYAEVYQKVVKKDSKN